MQKKQMKQRTHVKKRTTNKTACRKHRIKDTRKQTNNNNNKGKRNQTKPIMINNRNKQTRHINGETYAEHEKQTKDTRKKKTPKQQQGAEIEHQTIRHT